MKPQQLTTILVIAGTLFTLFIVFFKQEGGAAGFKFSLAFIAGPWLVLDALFIWLRWARGIAIVAGLMLALELLIYCTVFVNLQSSTDAVVYVVKPILPLFIFLPIGLFIRRAMDKRAATPGASANKGG
jgi:hypothetical protein